MMNSPTKPEEERQTHDADGRLWESMCAVISSVTTFADFLSLNYHLAQTSGAPQDHKQTAISTCPQRGHKMEETHLNKKALHTQAKKRWYQNERAVSLNHHHNVASDLYSSILIRNVKMHVCKALLKSPTRMSSSLKKGKTVCCVMSDYLLSSGLHIGPHCISPQLFRNSSALCMENTKSHKIL